MDKHKLESLRLFINNLVKKKKKLLLLISGGSDSVFLFHFLITYFSKLQIHLLHVNYQLRGENSQQDEDFVLELIEKYNEKKNLIRYFEKVTIDKNQNLQKQARDIRYTIAKKICTENKIDIILTAHHKNDLIENFFLKMIKGKNLLFSGLYNKKNVYRPLLDISKEEILEYLKKNKIDYRQDQSNFENKYERNRIRNQILNLTYKIFPESLKNIFRSIEYLSSYQRILKKIFFDGNYLYLKNDFLFFRKNFFDNFSLEEKLSMMQFYFNNYYPLMRISHLQYYEIVKNISMAFENKKSINLTIEKEQFYFQYPFLAIQKKELASFSFEKIKENFVYKSSEFNLVIIRSELQKKQKDDEKDIYFFVSKKYFNKDFISNIEIRFLNNKDTTIINNSMKNITSFLKKKKISTFFRESSYVLIYKKKVLFWFHKNKSVLEDLLLPYYFNFT